MILAPSATDMARVDELFKPLAAIVLKTMEHAQELLDRGEPGEWYVSIVETHRSPARQMELYKKGRVKTDGGWIPNGKTVTNALPNQTPHCVSLADGTPCSMAADLRVANRITGANAPDGHPAWAAIAAGAYVAGGDKIRLGAMFTTIRGGDWPHVEWSGWEKISKNGVLQIS